MLLVEDDFVLRSSLSELLTAEGYRVDSCADGREAFRRLHAPPRPNLILLDIMLPYLDGFELRALQRKSPLIANIPVVVISAHDLDPQSVDELGLSTPLRKPIDIDRLLVTMRDLTGPLTAARPRAAHSLRPSASVVVALGVAGVVTGAVGLAAADGDVDVARPAARGPRCRRRTSARRGRTGGDGAALAAASETRVKAASQRCGA